MNRVELINLLLSHTGQQNYLEIGVRDGKTITKVLAKNKVGVDPAYRLNSKVKWKRWVGLDKFKLVKQTSDDYFGSGLPHQDFKKGIDVVFVDGLHNFEQSLKDVNNALKHLSADGFIVLHDCNPKGAAQAYPVKHSYDEVVEKLRTEGIQGWTGEWNGDVWKTIVYLKATNPNLKIVTINADQGLGVIKVEGEYTTLEIDPQTIASLDYHFLEKHRKEVLGLVSEEEFLKKYLN